MWQEGYYRGYYILNVTPKEVTAQFYGKPNRLVEGPMELTVMFQLGSPSVATRNPWDLPLANFTAVSGDNHLQRPIAGGQVESGAVKFGEVKHTNLTLNTETGKWEVIGFDKMYLS